MQPDTFSIMTCDGCGLTDDTYKPDFTREQLIDDPDKTLMDIKTYWQDQGWLISLGYDLCPDCREKNE